ncbi:GNAT family N-acetyltransferase [Martelella sp. HB161492]|uniref:GNAT family N-acetyltransferase n=1 Tax=Martelella sp. HB161492 TaxID=2720726 RepID=UPI0015927CBD|nr:GNAT family N-acetyltransferase [Martelella sp. HB161492]
MFFVRTATAADLPAVRQLLVITWHATYDPLYGAKKVASITDDWFSLEKLQARLQRRDGEFLVADDGKMLGGMAFVAADTKEGDLVWLHQLYVHPDHQRHGIGRDLFAEIETCFPHARRMRLEVEPANANAVAFYLAHGFAEVGRTENCGSCNSGLPAIVMEKELPGA